MDLNFASIIQALGPNAVFIIANKARSAGDYMFANFLPEVPKPTYDAKSGTMTVRTTMAGLVGMDSKYPPTGTIETSFFNEQTAKIANEVTLPEAAIRELQALLQVMNGRNTVSESDILSAEALNFLDKAIIQSHLDTAEYLRGEALTNGALNWSMNGKTLAVDYGIPSGNLLPNRTGTDAYDGSTSMFWADMITQSQLLRYNVRARIMHPETLDMILSNPANKLRVDAQDGVNFTLRQYVGTTEQPNTDPRYTITFSIYGNEGEILDPANPGQTIIVPFMSRGKIIAVANATDNGYRVGQGSTPDPLDAMALGYTHLAPTVEGGGLPGRWADLTTPDDRPWQLRGRGVSNILPVIEAPKKLVVASTDMPS